MFQSSCTGGYSGVDIGMLLRMLLCADMWEEVQGDQKVSVHLTNNPHTTDELKMGITEYIRNVDFAILNMVFENTVRRVDKCLGTL